MLPSDFLEYAKKFEVGFLCWVKDGKPEIKIVDFEINEKSILIKEENLTEGYACLALSNEEYVWKSENAGIYGRLTKNTNGYEFLPEKIIWTLSFPIDEYPERIIKRWKKDDTKRTGRNVHSD